MVESERHFTNKVEKEIRYFIRSIQENITVFQHVVRDHWQIETSLHWKLDVVFREDESRVRKDHAPENLAMIRHLALNSLQKDTSVKTGTQAKRMKAAWDDKYLLKVLHS